MPPQSTEEWLNRDDLRNTHPLLDELTRAIAEATSSTVTDTSSSHLTEVEVSKEWAPLCPRCQAINPLWLLEPSPPGDRGHYLSISTHSSDCSFINGCSLCELLKSALTSVTGNDTDFKLKDPRIGLGECYDKSRPELSHPRGFGIMMPGRAEDVACFVLPVPTLNRRLRLLDTNFIDFEVIAGWMKSCSTHSSPCTIETSQPPLKDNIVLGLRLIDCKKKQLIEVDLEPVPYVCLSYVWGKNSDDGVVNGSLPLTLPATIDDAITVTIKLGFNYLWVDRYCINQFNQAETKQQIGMMDLIYRNAELTIIAAAGLDPSFGLPGVRTRRRRPAYMTRIWGIPFISTTYSPVKFLQESVWSTRGWTYQEVFFSRRRLTFTEQQAYFECSNMSYDEIFEEQHQVRSPKHRSGLLAYHLAFPNRMEETPGDIFDHIHRYSERSLTKPTDIINGILGTLRYFESHYGVPHCYGVPSLIPLRKDALQSSFFMDGLCWEHDGKPMERREGYPSWSWAGWYAATDPISWPSAVKYDNDIFFAACEETQLDVELSDNRVLTWTEAQAVLRPLSNSDMLSMSPFIHLSGSVATLRFSDEPDISDESDEVLEEEYLMSDGTYKIVEEMDYHGAKWSLREVELTRKGLDFPLSCNGIILGTSHIKWSRPPRNIMLLFKEILPGITERIGLIGRLDDGHLAGLHWVQRTVRLS